MRALYIELNQAVTTTLQNPANSYNFGLRFNKWAPFKPDGQDLKFDKGEYQKAVEAFNEWVGRQRAVLDHALERLDVYAKTAGRRKEIAVQCEATVGTPLVIGIGGAHPSEVGLTFHWTLGVPYLPASSLKGLARFGFEVEEINQFESLETLKKQSCSPVSIWTGKPFRGENGQPRPAEPLIIDDTTNPDWPPTVEHFGSQDAMGAVRFLDALPLPESLALQLDIMNPHYPDYYEQKSSPDGRPHGPTECQNPIPILFWTVKPGTRFRLTLIAHERHRSQLERALVCLKTAIEIYGLGAKTAVGYGRLQVVEGSERRWGGAYDRERAEREQAAARAAELAEKEARAKRLEQDLESDRRTIKTFKGPQDKSALEAILKKYDAKGLSPEERRLVFERLLDALSKSFHKGKLGDALRKWGSPDQHD